MAVTVDMQNPTGFSELCDGSGVDRAGRSAGISRRPAQGCSASTRGNAWGRAEATVAFESRHADRLMSRKNCCWCAAERNAKDRSFFAFCRPRAQNTGCLIPRSWQPTVFPRVRSNYIRVLKSSPCSQALATGDARALPVWSNLADALQGGPHAAPGRSMRG